MTIQEQENLYTSGLYTKRPIAVVRGLVDGLRRDLGEVAAHVLGEPCLRADLDAFDGARGDRGPRRVRLEASVVAAFAASAS